MKDHSQILSKAGLDRVVAITGRPYNTVKSWYKRNAIPADMWLVLSEAGIATLHDLAAGASRRRPAMAA